MPTAITSRFARPLRTVQASPAPDFALPIATAWLVLGSLAVLTVPSLRGSSAWFGWLPFWLVLMPAAECLILRWSLLMEASRMTLARVRRRGHAARGTRRNRRSVQRRSILAVALQR
jgi:hypothetical protein